MDPLSFSAAFLLSREPVTQQKLTESPMAVTNASAEPGQTPVPALQEQEPEPEHPRGPIAPPTPKPDFPENEPKPEPKPEPNLKPKPAEAHDLKSDLEQRYAQWLERTKTPVWSSLSPPRTAPAVWRLNDRFGVAWTHPDKTYLEQFVARRNATVLFVPGVTASAVTGFGYSSCSNGRCSR